MDFSAFPFCSALKVYYSEFAEREMWLFVCLKRIPPMTTLDAEYEVGFEKHGSELRPRVVF